MGFREVLPPSLQVILQNGLLDGVFEDALVPLNLYDQLADVKPWGAQIGSTSTMTRGGLMATDPTPITGQDATASTYGFEQYSVRMDQYANSIDTNMAESAMALASKYLEDNQKLGINAAQTINLVAQGALYGAYGSGATYVTAASSASTSLEVENGQGFTQAVVASATTNSDPAEGLTGTAVPTLVPVSGAAPIPVLIGGTANTVVGAALSSGVWTLTLGTAITATVGEAVTTPAGTGILPVSFRPSGLASAANLTVSNTATLSLFQSAVTRLRQMNVPTVKGAYQAHVSPVTIDELFADPAFQVVYTGRANSAAYRDLQVGDGIGDGAEFMGRFAGIDWIMDNYTPSATNPNGVEYYRPIVCGQGSLVKAPFENMGSLVAAMNAGGTVQIDMIGGVARILRAPLDRLGQVLSSTWSFIGGYTVGTDMLTGDSAVYKRAVVLEHA